MMQQQTKTTKLDRSIVSILPEPDGTPSSQAGISYSDERLHRCYGISIMKHALTLINDDQRHRLFPTASILFHRFYHRVSLTTVDVWSTAMACTVLAIKLNDAAQHVPLRDVIAAFQSVLCRRTTTCASITHANTTRAIDREWHAQLVATEGRILRELGFVLYWIPEDDVNPHSYIRPFCEYVLQETKKPASCELEKAAHAQCDIALHLDVSARFAPTNIACAAVWVAICSDTNEQPQQYFVHPHALVDILCGTDQRADVLCVANGILGVSDAAHTKLQQARTGYIAPLCETISFNGPGSPSWNCLVQNTNDG